MATLVLNRDSLLSHTVTGPSQNAAVFLSPIKVHEFA